MRSRAFRPNSVLGTRYLVLWITKGEGVIWYIALGSALGGAGRYLLGGLIQNWHGSSFPVGTLIVNISGSFLLGLISGYALESAAISAEVRAFLTIGICGGYTTFSTFSLETVNLLRDGDYARAASYLLLSVLISLAAVSVGGVVGHQIVLLRRGG